MKATTHLAVGLLFGLLTQPYFSGNNYLFLIFVLLGSLLPDIDHPNSKLGRKIKPLSWLFKLTLGHRTFFHSLLFGLLIVLSFGLLFGESYGIATLIGFLSHLFSDGLTKEGVNLFYPLKLLRIKGFIKTGSVSEQVFLLGILIIILVLLT